MTYVEALERLAALGPELRVGRAADATAGGGPALRKFSLDHIRALLAALGEPQRRFRSVLIAGTNGKGSTAATLATIANAAGIRTGLYTSPHLLRVNERMKVSGGGGLDGGGAVEAGLVEIGDEDFGRVFGAVDAAARELVERGVLPHTPSYFELMTAVGFCWFAEQGVELAVLEVGLGGRLDATNSVEPIVSVITDIGIDHVEYLGHTLGEIAGEKAGILRQNGVLVTLSQHPEANAAIGAAALRLDVRGVDAARFLPGMRDERTEMRDERTEMRDERTEMRDERTEMRDERTEMRDEGPAAGGSLLARNRYELVVEGEVVRVDSPLAGQHQQRNLALAIAAAVELRSNHGFAIGNAAIERGVRETVWPGRLEWVAGIADAQGRTTAPLLLDVAHNPAGAWTLRAALAQLPEGMPRTLIFSCLADKQIDEMAQVLLPLFDASSSDPLRARDHVILAPIQNARTATVEELLAAARRLDVPAHAAPHVAGALAEARAMTPPEGVIVVTGSVYLVGEVRALAQSPTTA